MTMSNLHIAAIVSVIDTKIFNVVLSGIYLF